MSKESVPDENTERLLLMEKEPSENDEFFNELAKAFPNEEETKKMFAELRGEECPLRISGEIQRAKRKRPGLQKELERVITNLAVGRPDLAEKANQIVEGSLTLSQKQQ